MTLKFTGGFAPLTGAFKVGAPPPGFTPTTFDVSTFSGTWTMTPGSDDRSVRRHSYSGEGGGKAFGAISGSDKVYYEVKVYSKATFPNPWANAGFIETNRNITAANEGIHQGGGWGFDVGSHTIIQSSNGSLSPAPAAFVTGDTWGFALDMDSGGLWLSINGAWQNGATIGEIEAGNTSNTLAAGLGAKTFTVGFGCWLGNYANPVDMEFNFGQDEWTYTIPDGFTGVPAPE